MKIIELKQNTPEWLKWRESHIGGSDAVIIMGESPYQTPVKLWKQKMGIEPSNYVSPAMVHGAKTEFEARAVFEGIMGKLFPSVCAESSTVPYMSASFDGLSEDGEIVEIKCPHSPDRFFEMRLKNEIPSEYYGQLQHQMFVAEAPYVYLFIYFGGDHILHKVERDEEYIMKMLEVEREFWRCLEEGEMPDMKAGDYFENVSEEWKSKALELNEIMNQKKKLDEIEKRLKKELIELSENRPSKGYGVTIYLQTRKGTLDMSKLEKDMKEEGFDLESYRKKPTSSWCVSVR